jgi:formamidase
MHAIRIDRSKPLAAEPHSGHNRFHPDLEKDTLLRTQERPNGWYEKRD